MRKSAASSLLLKQTNSIGSRPVLHLLLLPMLITNGSDFCGSMSNGTQLDRLINAPPWSRLVSSFSPRPGKVEGVSWGKIRILLLDHLSGEVLETLHINCFSPG
jgi:hypothetical protein